MRFQDEVWRHVPAGAFPLHIGYILKAQGRWNVQSEFGCIYTALTRKGAEAEWLKYLSLAGSSPSHSAPRDLVTLVVDVHPVLDLTRRNALASPSASFLTGNSQADLRHCQKLAEHARALGFQALLVPSAALKGEKNLIIYIDGIAGNLDLQVGKTRIPLNYKP